jgi:CheY-like chemotaxis protein
MSQPLPRVLLIDDDEISRDVLSMLLEMHGFPVDAVESGRHALSLVENLSDNDVYALPGLILMDTQMPGLSGLELIRWLRQFSTAPIVAISGSDPGEEIRAKTDAFLLKPIQAEDVVALLDGGSVKRITPLPGILSEVTASAELAANVPMADPVIDQVIDPVVLGKLRAMMPDSAVREIYAAVASDLKLRLDAIAIAMDAKDTMDVQRIAHTVKGGSSMVGVTSVVNISARLEISNLSVTWSNDLAQLRDALEALERMLGVEFPD